MMRNVIGEASTCEGDRRSGRPCVDAQGGDLCVRCGRKKKGVLSNYLVSLITSVKDN